MNAIDYVKQNGIEKAKIHIEKMKAERWINSFFNDLKQIVDAFELIERFGDLRQAKLNLEHMISHNQFEFCATNIDELQKAINLVEKCL